MFVCWLQLEKKRKKAEKAEKANYRIFQATIFKIVAKHNSKIANKKF